MTINIYSQQICAIRPITWFAHLFTFETQITEHTARRLFQTLFPTKKRHKMACTLLLPFCSTYRDRSQVEVRGIFLNAYKLRRKSKKKTDATVSCVDEMRKKS